VFFFWTSVRFLAGRGVQLRNGVLETLQARQVARRDARRVLTVGRGVRDAGVAVTRNGRTPRRCEAPRIERRFGRDAATAVAERARGGGRRVDEAARRTLHRVVERKEVAAGNDLDEPASSTPVEDVAAAGIVASPRVHARGDAFQRRLRAILLDPLRSHERAHRVAMGGQAPHVELTLGDAARTPLETWVVGALDTRADGRLVVIERAGAMRVELIGQTVAVVVDAVRALRRTAHWRYVAPTS